jgi:hypothetical protein
MLIIYNQHSILMNIVFIVFNYRIFTLLYYRVLMFIIVIGIEIVIGIGYFSILLPFSRG